MSDIEELTAERLRAWPLPRPEQGGDKDARGRVLVIGGSAQAPGAAVLAALSALRAGAGKLRVASVRSQAPTLALALPEALIMALNETEGGGVDPSQVSALRQSVEAADGVALGPGMMDEAAVQALLPPLLEARPTGGMVLDAAGLGPLGACRKALAAHEGRLVLTPHAAEMARLLGTEKADIEADPLGAARKASRSFQAVVIMKGQESYIVAPDGRALLNRGGHVGLATSGSGDTLAGLIAGLLARGAEPLQAAAWGVFSHAQAGARLAGRYGGVGFLARELPEAFTRVLNDLA